MAEHYGHVPDTGGVWSRWKYRQNVDLFRNAACFVAWSQWAADSLIADYGVNPEKVVVIPVGVDLHTWSNEAAQSKRIDQGAVKILFVGGDLHRKGGDD